MLPACRFKFALGVTHERDAQSFCALDKIKSETTLCAEEIAVDPAFVAIVGTDDLGSVVRLPHAEGYFASVAAVGADGGDMVHLPWPRLVTIAPARESAHRAYIDAHAALFAVKTFFL